MPELFVNEITSVGAVTAGDNPAALIEFWKAADTKTPPSVEKRSIVIPDPASAGSATRKTRSTLMPEFDLTALGDDASKVTDYIAQLETDLAAATTTNSAVDDPAEVVKSADPAVQAILKAQADELDELRKARAVDAESLASEIAKRRTAEFAARAEPLIPLLGKPQEIGPVLDQIEKAVPDAYATLEPALLAAAALVAKSDLFKELGHGEDAETDPNDMKDAWVTKRLQDGDERSRAELNAEFWKLHPDAVAASREGK